MEESNQVKNLVGEFEGMANRNKARPVYPDHYTQKRSPKEGPKFIKIEKIDRSENDYQPQEKVSNLSEILFWNFERSDREFWTHPLTLFLEVYPEKSYSRSKNRQKRKLLSY